MPSLPEISPRALPFRPRPTRTNTPSARATQQLPIRNRRHVQTGPQANAPAPSLALRPATRSSRRTSARTPGRARHGATRRGSNVRRGSASTAGGAIHQQDTHGVLSVRDVNVPSGRDSTTDRLHTQISYLQAQIDADSLRRQRARLEERIAEAQALFEGPNPGTREQMFDTLRPLIQEHSGQVRELGRLSEAYTAMVQQQSQVAQEASQSLFGQPH